MVDQELWKKALDGLKEHYPHVFLGISQPMWFDYDDERGLCRMLETFVKNTRNIMLIEDYQHRCGLVMGGPLDHRCTCLLAALADLSPVPMQKA
jgi:hypothetical protein